MMTIHLDGGETLERSADSDMHMDAPFRGWITITDHGKPTLLNCQFVKAIVVTVAAQDARS